MKHLVKLANSVLLLSVAFSITGCAISSKTFLPDGSEGYSISCDGAAVGMNVCFEKAGKICGAQGYDLLNREGQVTSYGMGMADNQSAFVNHGSFNTKSILIRCKP